MLLCVSDPSDDTEPLRECELDLGLASGAHVTHTRCFSSLDPPTINDGNATRPRQHEEQKTWPHICDTKRVDAGQRLLAHVFAGTHPAMMPASHQTKFCMTSKTKFRVPIRRPVPGHTTTGQHRVSPPNSSRNLWSQHYSIPIVATQQTQRDTTHQQPITATHGFAASTSQLRHQKVCCELGIAIAHGQCFQRLRACEAHGHQRFDLIFTKMWCHMTVNCTRWRSLVWRWYWRWSWWRHTGCCWRY